MLLPNEQRVVLLRRQLSTGASRFSVLIATAAETFERLRFWPARLVVAAFTNFVAVSHASLYIWVLMRYELRRYHRE